MYIEIKRDMKQLDKSSIRKQVNSFFGIRVYENASREKGLCGKSRLVGFDTFVEIFGELHAYHFAVKALHSLQSNPTFRIKGCSVVFFQR